MPGHDIYFDVEVTNRCNADCSFCPRAATPHQGLMSVEVFTKTLERIAEFTLVARARSEVSSVRVVLCGLGEPLLNRHVTEYVHQVRAAGFDCEMSSNGALLDERRSRALLEAGLQQLNINCGEIGDDYEAVCDLPFARTRDNIVRFLEMAGDDCRVQIILVDHRRDRARLEMVRRYWERLGVERFHTFELVNRAGALDAVPLDLDVHEHTANARALLARYTATPICDLAYKVLFVGYDGNYYLCGADWRKQVPMGSVFERSFLATFEDRLRHMSSATPLCAGCTGDPVNHLALRIRDRAADEENGRLANLDAAIIAQAGNHALAFLGDIDRRMAFTPARARSIPVRAQ